MTASAVSPFAAASNIRKVDPFPKSSVPLRKKDDRDEDYMAFGGKSKKKSSAPTNGTSLAAAVTAPKALKIDISTMEMFFKLNVDVPTGPAEFDAAIAAIEEKKNNFLHR